MGRIARVIVLGVLFSSRLTSQQPSRTMPVVHPELAALFRADQDDRAPERLAGLATPERDSVMRTVVQRDRARLLRVREIMASTPGLSAADYYHAAMVAQHGSDSLDYRSAHEWAQRAVALDSTDGPSKYLVAASWDRYQRSVGKPQWYGTQIVRRPGKPFELYAIDTTRVTDAERARLGVPTLAAQRSRVDSLNARRP